MKKMHPSIIPAEARTDDNIIFISHTTIFCKTKQMFVRYFFEKKNLSLMTSS